MRSWNNDLFYFDTKTSRYFKIKDVGSRPSPRAAFGYAQTDNVGFIFGGRCASGRQNDFHRFDFETRTWSLMKPSGPNADLPCGRSWLSLVHNDNSVLVYGGLDKHNRTELIFVWLQSLFRGRAKIQISELDMQYKGKSSLECLSDNDFKNKMSSVWTTLKGIAKDHSKSLVRSSTCLVILNYFHFTPLVLIGKKYFFF